MFETRNIPVGLMLSGFEEIEVEKTIVKKNDIQSKMFPRKENQVCIEFIMPYRMTPNIIRLFFFPIRSGTHKKNYAYKIVNKNAINDHLFTKKLESPNLFMVNWKNEDSWNLNLMNGKSLKAC